MQVPSPAAAPHHPSVLHDGLAADAGRDRPAAEPSAVLGAVGGKGTELRGDHLGLQIQGDDGEIAVVAGTDVSLTVVDVEDPRRRGGQAGADALQPDAAPVITLGE